MTTQTTQTTDSKTTGSTTETTETKTTRRKPLTARQFSQAVADAAKLDWRTVASLLSKMAELVDAELGDAGPGVVTIPGIVRIRERVRAGRPAGTMVRLPGRTELTPAAARPESRVRSAQVVAALKSRAVS